MAFSKPKNSDLASTSSSSSASQSRRFSSSSSTSSATATTIHHRSPHHTYIGNSSSSNMTVDGILRNVYSAPSSDSALLDAPLTLMDTPTPPPSLAAGSKTVDEMWREIVSGRKELKEEPDEMMTLEDFLAKAGAVDDEDPVPMPTNAISMLDNVEGSIIGFGNGVEVGHGSGELRVGRGKRGRAPVLEQMDKAAQQRQKRMIKNRESAARSRERKQAYQVELESLAVKLEEEHEQLLKEKVPDLIPSLYASLDSVFIIELSAAWIYSSTRPVSSPWIKQIYSNMNTLCESGLNRRKSFRLAPENPLSFELHRPKLNICLIPMSQNAIFFISLISM
ncbi:G-box-binding factor 4 [Linum perenne]